MFKNTQRSFAGGWLDRELMGRTDLAKYYTGATKIENLLVRRQGNLAKRRGTDFVADLANILGRDSGTPRPLGGYRLVPVVRERDKGYYALLADRRAFLLDTARGILCSDGEWRRSVAPYAAPADGEATVAATDFSLIADFVARIGLVTYESLDAAIEAAAPGDTIVLGHDVAVSAAKTFKGVLDLNGHTLTVNANVALEFRAGNGVQCGIVSSKQNARLAWNVSGTHAKDGITHASGIFEMRDVSADYTGSGNLLKSTGTSPVDRIELTRCTLSTSSGQSVVYLSGTSSNQVQTFVVDADELGNSGYSWFSAGCLIRGCAITYESAGGEIPGAGNPCPLMTSTITNANARKFTFVSGTLSSNGGGKVAANIGLFVYGGRLRCSGIGKTTTATYAAALSRMVRGLCSAADSNMAGYVAPGTEKAATAETVDDVNYYCYAPAGAEYANADNVWTPATWSNDESSDEYKASEGSLTTGAAPYCIATPYADAELDELDCFQSGDTVFLAHARHAPARLMVSAAGTALSFARLSFNASAWRRPRITLRTERVHPESSSLSYSNNTATETRTSVSGTVKTTVVLANNVQKSSSTVALVSRTVRYCATYVKDGQESPPSAPVSVTYGAPWEEGGKITLALSRGANAEEPDWYNVYKSESTGWGLIGSTAKPAAVRAEPAAIFGYAARASQALTPGLLPSAYLDGDAVASTESADVAGETPQSAARGLSVKVTGGIELPIGTGGMQFGSSVPANDSAAPEPAACVLEFGLDSGVKMDTLVLCMDSHALSYERVDASRLRLSDRRILAGKYVTAKVTHQPTAGDTSSTVVATASATLTEAAADDGQPSWTGESVLALGEVAADDEAAAATLAAGSAVRKAVLSFPDLAADRQVVRVEITCSDENDQPCECVLCGFAMSLSATASQTFDDNYITPDMSLSPPSAENAFAGNGDFPSCVGIYQQRLVFAASADRPAAFWMSAVGDLYTFAPHDSIREDDAIEAELAATEFPRINHLVSGRDLVMLCDGGEWKVSPVTGNAITYKTISTTLQSSIGCAKWLKPLTVGNEIVFAERTGMALRSVAYNYASDGYESQDLSVLAGNIFAGRRIVRMCYKQHPDSTVVCALADGSVATLVYMREHDVVAWSRHVLGGGWLARDVATDKALNGGTTDVALVAERDGVVQLWAVRPDDPAPTVAAQACLDGCRTMTGAEAAAEGAWLEGWVAVDLLTGVAYPSKSALQAAASYGSRSYLCGFPIRSELVTVRPEPSPQDTIQFEVKNLKSVEARTISAGSYSVRSFAAAPGVKPTAAKAEVPVSAGTVELVAADVANTVLGANTADGRGQIVHEDIWPMQLLQLSANYEIQPLSNSAG